MKKQKCKQSIQNCFLHNIKKNFHPNFSQNDENYCSFYNNIALIQHNCAMVKIKSTIIPSAVRPSTVLQEEAEVFVSSIHNKLVNGNDRR